MTTVRSRTRRVVAVLLAAGLALAACGGDDDSASSGDTSDPIDVATTTDETGDTGPEETAGEDEAGTDDTASPPDSTTAESSGDQPNVDRDASLVYASCCVPQVFDPHNLSGGGANGWFSLYDRLTYIGTPEDPLAADVSPMIAESWEYSDDGLALTLSLRDDVTFNDGTAVTADAVKASLERAKASSSGAATVLASVESVEVVDDHAVQLNLSQPDGSIVANLAGPAGAVMNPAVFNDPSVDLDLAPPAGAGSGPFALESHEPLTRSVLVRADDEYWDPEANYLASIEIRAEPDTTTRLNGLQSGQYQLAQLFSRFVPEGQRLADSGEFEMHLIDGRSNSILFLRHTDPKLSDPRVRQAIAMAVDREGIAEGALAGTCTVNGQSGRPASSATTRTTSIRTRTTWSRRAR